jgi:hypothetical protein
MERKLISVFSLCVLFVNGILGQSHEEKCIYGNCKNGFGVLAISGARSEKAPKPFHNKNIFVNDPSTFYYYYQAGDFVKSKLNGKGYRLEPNRIFNDVRARNWLIDVAKSNLLDSIADQCIWYEAGMYVDGVLNGKGVQIVHDASIIEGTFLNGAAYGPTYKIGSDMRGFFSVLKDRKTNRFNIITGRQYYGLLEDSYCINCKVVEFGYGYQGATIGRRIDEHFLNGWVIKDYAINETSGKTENVKPYRGLYVGNMELFRLHSAEQSVTIKEVKLENGSMYLGEVDEKGNPYGFGKMALSSNSKWTYEGFVDNGKPEGWGIIQLEDDQYYEVNHVLGGFFVNGVITKGVILKPGSTGEKLLIYFQPPNDATKLVYDDVFKDIRNGFYTKTTYRYEDKVRRWFTLRTESGEKVNGYEKNVWVSQGQTIEEKRRQRLVSNGFISISDLTIGDIIVLNGLANPVVSNTGGVFFLKNKKIVSPQTTNQVQLSKHKSSEFYVSCKLCNGSCQESYMYQRPPQEVQMVSTTYETEVLDFTAWRKTTTETKTYIKTFALEKRVRVCSVCNGKGSSFDVDELTE